jgi:replication factor C large subunit
MASETFGIYYMGLAESLDDIVGNEYAVQVLRKYAADINNRVKRNPLLLSGPPGTGKTTAVHLLAKEHNWNVVEMNASDYRDKESIDRLLLAASQSRTIFGARNLIFLDEIDELASRLDKGGSGAISAIMKVSKSPIIFTANDRWERDITFLRNTTDPVDFKKVSAIAIAKVLAKIAAKDGLSVGRETMDIIAGRANGDVRSAINDLFVMNGASADAVEVMGMRDRKNDIFNALDKVFFANTFSGPLSIAANLDMDNETFIEWVGENIPKRYFDAEDLSNAMDSLALATVYSTRATRAQYYTYWRYMNALMSSGVALSKTNYPDRTARYAFPKKISTLSQSKTSRTTEDQIAEKLQKRIHLNASRIKRDQMPIIASGIKAAIASGEDKEQVYESMERKYGLDGKESDWLVEKYPY